MSAPRARVRDFCRAHFSWPGVWQLNRCALGWDLLRAPVNVAYAPVWVTLQLIALLLRGLRCRRPAAALARLPAGLETSVHRRVRLLLEQELFGAGMLAALAAVQQQELQTVLLRYQSARHAVAEITANLLVLLLGILLFQAFTPGGLGLGRLSGDALQLHWSIEQFWAGQSLGQLWYGWFPPETPLWLSVLCVGFSTALIALMAALSGLLSDPLQQCLGWHERRLHGLLDALEQTLTQTRGREYRPKEPFWARVFDVLDWLRL